MTSKGTGLVAEARMEQDIVAVREYARKLVKRPSVSEPASRVTLSQIDGVGVDEALEQAWNEELQAAIGSHLASRSKQRDAEVQNLLAASLFEQKWADLVLGELQGQVLVSCLEQGKLLAKVRAQLATSFSSLAEAQTITLDELHDMARAVEFFRAKARDLAKQQSTIRAEIERKHKEDLAHQEALANEKYAAYEEDIREVEASQQRMSDTLAALNGIYRKMRDDAETMRNLDMSDVCAKLEKTLAAAQTELDELRPLRAQCEELTRTTERQSDHIEEQTEEIERLREELEQRNGLVQSLMEQHSAHLSFEELGKEKDATGVQHASEEAFEDDDEESDEDEDDEDDEDEDEDEEEGEEVVEANEGADLAIVADPANEHADGEEDAGAGNAEEVAGADGADTNDETDAAGDGAKKTKGKKKRGKGKKLKRKGKKKAKKKETPFIVGKKIRKTTDTVKVPGVEDAKLGGPGAAGEIREGMDEASSAKTFLCPRCNVALDRAGNIDPSALANSDNRLACEGYRMLLPNLMGYRPERPRAWVLRCMRSIIRAKRCADFSAARMGKPKIRFPEFVYLWFTPRKERLAELESFEGQEAVLLAKAEADESRWGLYYGIKKLAKELPEARVFYTFLDEKYGEDDFAFYLHCLTIMEAVVNERRCVFAWGFNTNACDYDAMREVEDEEGGEDDVDDFIFVEIRHAVEVTERVMKRASEDDCKRAVKTLVENAVQEEIRITPTTGQRIIDINVCLRVLLQEYRDEQAHRRAALRLMFGCASSGPEEQVVNKCVDLSQMITIVQTLNSRAGPAEAVTLYRLAYEMGRGKVNIESFTQAANRLNFFSDCLRLPSHFGTEAANELSSAQCIQIGSQVRQQMALLRPIVDTFMRRLDPPARRELQHLVYDVSDELERGSVTLDGRRALCAIRRMLFFLLGERNGRRELYGEQDRSGDVAVVNAKREVETLCAILRDFAKDDREERMQELQLKSSAMRIQQKWRQRQELAPGVPHTMRKLMSGCFEPGVIVEAPAHRASIIAEPRKDDEANASAATVRRRLLRAPVLPEDFALIFMEEAYKYKLCADAVTGTRASVEEAIHGMAITMFGVRAVAERFIYDFFYSVHKHAATNLRLRLFARFTGVRTPALLPPKPKSALDPIEDMASATKLEHEIGYGLENDWSHEPMKRIWPKALRASAAAHTYVSALAIIHQAAGSPSGKLFVDAIPLPKAVMVVKSVFKDACNPSKHRPCGAQPSARVVEECMTRIERLPVQSGNVETDKLALIVLQGWHAESIYRTRSLSAAFEPREASVETIVSLPEFSRSCAPLLLDAQTEAQDVSMVDLYRRLCVESEPYPVLQPGAIQMALHSQGDCTWASRVIGGPAGGQKKEAATASSGASSSVVAFLQTFAPAPESRWRLLVYFWQPVQATISGILVRIQNELPTKNLKRSSKKARARMMQEDIDREDDEYARTLERRRLLCSRLDTDLEIFMNAYSEMTSGGAEKRSSAGVESAWALMRTFLEGLQLARYELGEADEPIVDRWDQERLERMRPLEQV
ncbi:Hypothetical Protein FCC1311_069912 [Hondaea fermentalgiana]|uniref:Uncharacterized protein n=1 Tax=Hondaea fermentalgiana TaxID=2315210 RepID=A0A2R5GQZ0_9STRA|nr:Hypothetical Protein FCC1311_069912 [Hondaea fermentalgiana]|eukprot:GBG30771.1 Hypothetical Protein FCC1311_069912 [Hondaea fermentalgiana]